MSKAEIFREKDITLAILNYSQAIKCRPKDADLYFKRGEMYEKTNKVLAIDDYSKVSFVMLSAPTYRFYIANILSDLFILKVFGLHVCMCTRHVSGAFRGQRPSGSQKLKL